MNEASGIDLGGALRVAEKNIQEMKDQMEDLITSSDNLKLLGQIKTLKEIAVYQDKRIDDANARIDSLIMLTNVMKQIIESNERRIDALTPR